MQNKICFDRQRDRQTEYALIDIFKLVAALLVVCIHINPFEDINPILAFWCKQFIARAAVPFFFISASFFLFRNDCAQGFNISKTNKYARRMLFIYFLWFVIYNIPLVIINGLDVILIVKSFVLGYSHLWYLSASAFAFFVLGLLLYKKVSLKVILIISALLYIVGLFGEVFYGLIFNETTSFYVSSSRNGLFFAPLYIVVGLIYSYNRVKIKLSFSVVATILFAVMWIVEVLLCNRFGLARDYNMSLFMAPTMFFSFNILLNVKLKKAFNTKLLRNLSTYIYLIHMLVSSYGVFLITAICELITNVEIQFNSLEKYVITVFISSLASFVIIRLKKIKGFKWLNILT